MAVATLACADSARSARDTAMAAGVTARAASAHCDAIDRAGTCVLWGPSLLELIARPELYEGKRVRTIGFVHFEFEGNLA